MWALPVAFLAVNIIAARFFPPDAFVPTLFIVATPLLLVCAFVAGKPLRRGLVTFWQTFLWCVLVPFVIWTLLIVGMFSVALLSH
jgi:hypothetical protein